MPSVTALFLPTSTGLLGHAIFDGLAYLSWLGLFWWLTRRLRGLTLPLPRAQYPLYLLLLWAGALLGAFGLGTLNAVLSGASGGGRSILGALLGGILAAELFKWWHGVRGSTGGILALPLSVSIAIGRLGCFLAGLADYTYGTATTLPWGVDFGDGVARHPVQLYESAAMWLAAAGLAWLLYRHPQRLLTRGFYFFVGWYGLTRFGWEFLKPYQPVFGPLNVFHLGAAVLVVYAAVMLFFTHRRHA